jgi:hypothetical protein
MHPQSGIHLRRVLSRYPSSPLTRERGVFFIFPVVVCRRPHGSYLGIFKGGECDHEIKVFPSGEGRKAENENEVVLWV